MLFRKATAEDFGRIWEIISHAKEQMRLRGSLQWQTGYPAAEDIAADIEKGYGYVFCDGECMAAYGAVVFDGEPAYGDIEGGWLTSAQYVVVHRLAVAGNMTGRGIATQFMRATEGLARSLGVPSFRVDTNFDNEYMQRVLSKLGFAHCGRIMYEGDYRLAYEKILS